MTMLYPTDFHRRIDRRWAERRSSASADVRGAGNSARLAGQRRTPVPAAMEPLDTPRAEPAQPMQRRQC